MRLYWQTLILRAPEGETGASTPAPAGDAPTSSAPSGDSGGSSADVSSSPSPSVESAPAPASVPASDDIFEFPSDVTDDGFADEEVVLQPQVPQEPVQQPEGVPPAPAPAPSPTPVAGSRQVEKLEDVRYVERHAGDHPVFGRLDEFFQ